jgi:hypothetical protein
MNALLKAASSMTHIVGGELRRPQLDDVLHAAFGVGGAAAVAALGA